MLVMNQVVEAIRVRIRAIVRVCARILNRATGGRLSANTVTIVGTLAHIPIAVLIALGHFNILAAVLLLIFGLFDTLDGELARLQNRASENGMLLDASTDRMKEVMLYAGIAYALAQGSHPTLAAVAVAACGASLCVSYIKAKGEAAVAARGQAIPHATLNKLFKDGLLTFELRIFVLIVGLVAHQLAIVAGVIAVLASYTALQRLVRISKALRHV